MNGVSTYWFSRLWAGLGVVDIWAAFRRSLALGLVVMALTVGIAFYAGLAFRKGFRGAGLVMPTSLSFAPSGKLLVTPGLYKFDPR